MSLFFTSDTHFGHGFVARLRGFDDPTAMDDVIVAAWNAKVTKNDDVYHLGDFSFRNGEQTVAILDRLEGRKHLIRGNHDRLPKWVEARFSSVQDYRRLRIGEHRVVLLHYPMATWDGAHHGSWHLHGHCHGNLRLPAPMSSAPRLDVGVDTNGMAPYSWDDVVRVLSSMKYEPVDHHDEGYRE